MEHIEYESLLSLPAVATLTGLSAATILSAVKLGSFPPPVPFDGDLVWLSSEIANWLEAQPLSPPTFEGGEAA